MSADARPAFRTRTFGALLLFALLAVVAVIPWWRNHDILRDLYDYGLFINVNARLAQGERPFADFTTPAQSATFVLNYLSEKMGGGTYVGMTRGAAALIVGGLAVLGVALARRWSPWTALLIAAAVICTSASQHTIVFYNPVGIISLALVVWSFAVAPLLRKEDIGWHALAGLGLFLGGLNKINYHLLACAMAVGWIVFGAVRHQAGLRPLVLTLLFVLFFGAILPVAVELLWTGASFKVWFYNVVQLPLQSRGGRISAIASPQLYLETFHNYYGPLRIRPAGLIGLLVPLVAAIAAWRTSVTAPAHRAFLVLAAAFAALASTALLITNNEIAYLALSATLVFGVSLWLGFNIPARGRWFASGLLLPAILIGAAGWESAWLGQRSQFGHANDPRSSYLTADHLGTDFAYARGLRLPQATVESLSGLARWRDVLPVDHQSKIFYGPGSEWLEHVWPMPKVRGLALIPSAFDGPRESEMFENEVLRGERYRYILVPKAWDYWNPSITHTLAHRFFSERIGPSFMAYEKLRETVLSARPLEYFPGIGGNIVSNLLFSRMPVLELSDGRRFLGIDRGLGELELGAPSNRAGGEVVLKRVPGSGPVTSPVQFQVLALAGTDRYSRWSIDATLPEGQDEHVIPTGELDSMGMPLAFTVNIPEALHGRIVAGWRAPWIFYTSDSSIAPPRLRHDTSAPVRLSPQTAARFLPAGLRDSVVYLHNATVEDGQVRFWPGGEIWIHLQGLFREIDIRGHTDHPDEQNWHARMRVVHYVSGRIEHFHPLTEPTDASARFRFVSAQGDGWLGLLANDHLATSAFVVKLESASRH